MRALTDYEIKRIKKSNINLSELSNLLNKNMSWIYQFLNYSDKIKENEIESIIKYINDNEVSRKLTDKEISIIKKSGIKIEKLAKSIEIDSIRLENIVNDRGFYNEKIDKKQILILFNFIKNTKSTDVNHLFKLTDKEIAIIKESGFTYQKLSTVAGRAKAWMSGVIANKQKINKIDKDMTSSQG